MVPFKPTPNSTVSISASTTSARAALLNRPSSGLAQVRVYNDGAAVAFVKFGDSTVAALSTVNMPIPPGAVEVFTIDVATVTHAAAVTSSGAATVYVSTGDGA